MNLVPVTSFVSILPALALTTVPVPFNEMLSKPFIIGLGLAPLPIRLPGSSKLPLAPNIQFTLPPSADRYTSLLASAVIPTALPV